MSVNRPENGKELLVDKVEALRAVDRHLYRIKVKKRSGTKIRAASKLERENLNYLAALAAFHSAILARTSLLMHQMKVKQQKEPRAATAGKPQTIILMPVMVEAA